MSRFRQEADDRIIDRAAGLFARHGFEHTSLRELAEAVGLSKAGLLHHFPSKEALHEAVQASCRDLERRVADAVAPLPPGPDKDRRSLELLIDVALDRPGLVALALTAVNGTDPLPEGGLGEVIVHEAFGVAREQADSPHELERAVRVVGALTALAVLTLLANGADQKTAWRPHILSTCFDALGHRAPLEA
ncbi:TetR/AcrR family transcriptional regulator [Saccharothrix variisporea]|uniref:TetR family transcriptional regulator n=1 Tax=Saccharothrix variisporea TaxID=543527 RepID=A0A495X696_9PSEU|nr:helix-turn-helix domain-containing protein [Saccharothrix variisporea]RKT69049.1 TetR family transcriptional regulator [Saccharothrix variisporea]